MLLSKIELQDICHFSKALVSGNFFRVNRAWPEEIFHGVAFTMQNFEALEEIFHGVAIT